MDWYYPLLGGVLHPDEATRRLTARWDDTWTAATVIVATDALSHTTPSNGLFRGKCLTTGVVEGTCTCPATR